MFNPAHTCNHMDYKAAAFVKSFVPVFQIGVIEENYTQVKRWWDAWECKTNLNVLMNWNSAFNIISSEKFHDTNVNQIGNYGTCKGLLYIFIFFLYNFLSNISEGSRSS